MSIGSACRGTAVPVGAGEAYDTFDFMDRMRELNTTPHVQNLVTRRHRHRRPHHPSRRGQWARPHALAFPGGIGPFPFQGLSNVFLCGA